MAAGWLLAVSHGAAEPVEATSASTAWLREWRTNNRTWRGIHLSVASDGQAASLTKELPKLAALGVNVIIAEVDYSFEFQSHPELRSGGELTKAQARRLAKEARANGIRLIPEINCLGHQSWARNTLPLLVKHPEFDETPGQYPGNQGLYCRSRCPQHPEVNEVVFALADELVDAFEADAFHAGMDEVFIMASEFCPRCKGGDPAKLFARAVNDFHRHIVTEKKLELLIWGDRLLASKALGYSEWDAATNRTEAAIDLIPKDIIVCDWHYGKKTNYASVPLLLERGFRVWPSAWQPLPAALAFNEYSHQQKSPRLLGFLCTVWGKAKIEELATWPPVVETLPGWK